MVFSNEDASLVGYFTITIKPITVNAENFSNTMKRKIARVSELDEENGTYTLSAYLIAQLGKNFKDGANDKLMYFYEDENGFKRFDVREAKSGVHDSHTLLQLLKII